MRFGHRDGKDMSVSLQHKKIHQIRFFQTEFLACESFFMCE